MRIYVLLAAMLWLAGCAPTRPDPIARQKDSGYLFADLPSWKAPPQITLRSLSTGTEYPIETVGDMAGKTAGTWLPAGDYALTRWGAFGFKGYPPIHIESDRATTLGSLVPVQAGGYQFFVVPMLSEDARQALSDAMRSLGDSAPTQPPLEWKPEHPPEPFEAGAPESNLGLVADLLLQSIHDRNKPALRQQLLASTSIESMLELARASSLPVMDFPYAGSDGSLYYGAEFGQIRVRQANGQWTAWDTGTLRSVTALTKRDATWFAGYEDGRIRSSADGGKTWQVVGRVPGNESVQDLVWTGERWLVFSVRHGLLSNVAGDYIGVNHASLLSTESDAFANFTTRRSRDFELRTTMGQWVPRGQRGGDYYYLNLMPELLRLDLRTMEWTKLDVPAETNGFAVNKDASVVTAYISKGIFSKLHVSSDRGDHWTRYDMPPIATSRIAFADSGHGEALRINMHAFTSDLEQYRYREASHDWVMADRYPKGCRRVINDGDGKPRFCLTGAGSIISRDGKDWRMEFAAD
jgi:hypothetical protein